jgi:hypothetical protein
MTWVNSGNGKKKKHECKALLSLNFCVIFENVVDKKKQKSF